jgi:hypothetical protein
MRAAPMSLFPSCSHTQAAGGYLANTSCITVSCPSSESAPTTTMASRGPASSSSPSSSFPPCPSLGSNSLSVSPYHFRSFGPAACAMPCAVKTGRAPAILSKRSTRRPKSNPGGLPYEDNALQHHPSEQLLYAASRMVTNVTCNTAFTRVSATRPHEVDARITSLIFQDEWG